MHFLILQPDNDLNKKTTSRFMTAANPSVNVSGINYYTRYATTFQHCQLAFLRQNIIFNLLTLTLLLVIM
jgi:hypothetical protein